MSAPVNRITFSMSIKKQDKIILTVCLVGPTQSVSSGVASKHFASSTASKTTSQTDKSLNLNRLKSKPRLSMEVEIEIAVMCANDHHLLRTTPGHLNLINENGKEFFTVKIESQVRSIWWSSHLNRFLILLYNKTLHLLDAESQNLRKVADFSRSMRCCTSFENTLLVSSDSPEVIIEVYDMKHNFKLTNVFRSPLSCKKNQVISRIQFNASGSRLGVVYSDSESSQYFFELRNPNDMHILTTVDLVISTLYYHFVPLPTGRIFDSRILR